MFNKSKIYSVYVKKGVGTTLESALFVRDGFSLWAFIFEIFYFLYNRAWVFSAAIFLFYAIKLYLLNTGIISLAQSDIITIAAKLIFAFEASNVKEASLQRKGYILLDVVTAKDEMEAQKRFFDKYAYSQNNVGVQNLKTA